MFVLAILSVSQIIFDQCHQHSIRFVDVVFSELCSSVQHFSREHSVEVAMSGGYTCTFILCGPCDRWRMNLGNVAITGGYNLRNAAIVGGCNSGNVVSTGGYNMGNAAIVGGYKLRNVMNLEITKGYIFLIFEITEGVISEC